MKRGARRGKLRRVLLVGVPNCGKSALFCCLTGAHTRVGNLAGVTVEQKAGRLRGVPETEVVDLPGICGVTPHTAEEEVTHRALDGGGYDMILQVADGAALARSLTLTPYLCSFGVPVAVAVNRLDLAGGRRFLPEAFRSATGLEPYPVCARNGAGTEELLRGIGETLAAGDAPVREGAGGDGRQGSTAKDGVEKAGGAEGVRRGGADRGNCGVPPGKHGNSPWGRVCGGAPVGRQDSRIFAARVAALSLVGENARGVSRLDRCLCTGPLAPLVLIMTLAVLYALTSALFSLCGALLGGMGERLGTLISDALAAHGVTLFTAGLLGEGLVGGAVTALTFLPPLFVFYVLTGILEDTGYLARMAFLSDPLLARLGLGGHAVLPLLVSAGCGVTGVCACRTLPAGQRRGCAGFCTWVPCHAKLPVIACVCGYCGFHPLTVCLLFALSLALAVLASALCGRGEGSFCCELPPLTLPSPRVVMRSAAARAREFAVRAGSLIALTGTVVWAVSHVCRGAAGWELCDISRSLLAEGGRRLYPLFAPLGFAGWECVTATLTGLLAKENAVVTLTLLGGTGALGGRGQAMAFCLFNLFCPPCVAAIAAMRREIGRRAWLYLAAQTLFAAFAAAVAWRALS